MPTVSVNLDATQYVKVNTGFNPMMLQALRDSVRITLSELKPAVDNIVFHTLSGGDEPLQFSSIDTNVWALAVTNRSGLIVSETTATPTSPDIERTAFGETTVAELEPSMQIQFPYSINPALLKTFNNKNGDSTIENSMMKLSTGAIVNSSSVVNTLESIQYHPGQGTLNRFTAIFTQGVAGSEQTIGIGNVEDGFFFGFNGVDFGILHRTNGSVEIQQLDITTGSTTVENVTVTLNGDVALVPVTASGDLYTTAQEIADFDYSDIGHGWDVHHEGDGAIKFVSYDTGVKSGVFSLTATTAAGTFSRLIASRLPTENWINQIDWNRDKADGSNKLPVIDVTKGNVFEIRYQWLGFGPAYFYVEDPKTGKYVLVHVIEYANTSVVPSINNPTLPLHVGVRNITNDTDVVLKTSSIAAFTEGVIKNTHFHRGFDIGYSISGAVEQPIFTLHNKDVFQGKKNRIRVKLTLVVANAESNKASTMRLRKDSNLKGSVYSDIDADISVIEVDQASTIVSNGIRQLGIGFGKSSQVVLDLENKSYYLDPGEKITFTQQADTGGASTVEGTVSVNWEELH